MTVNSWYSNEDARLSQIQTDTKTIGTADIELLVQAMSSFSQPNTGAISQDASLSGGFKETITIEVRWSTAFSMFNSLILNAFFKAS